MARHIQRVENYTNAALIMGLVNLLWVLMAIWVNWGWGRCCSPRFY